MLIPQVRLEILLLWKLQGFFEKSWVLCGFAKCCFTFSWSFFWGTNPQEIQAHSQELLGWYFEFEVNLTPVNSSRNSFEMSVFCEDRQVLKQGTAHRNILWNSTKVYPAFPCWVCTKPLRDGNSGCADAKGKHSQSKFLFSLGFFFLVFAFLREFISDY